MEKIVDIKIGDMISFQNMKLGLRYVKFEYDMYFINLSIKIGERFYAVEVNPEVCLLIEGYSIEVLESKKENCKIKLEKKNVS